jgi:hypothetical protein
MQRYRKQLERYQFQMGPAGGRLATALDILTDSLALVGQHGVYCRTTPDREAMDIRLVMEQIEESKGLIIEALEELRSRTPPGSPE